MQTSPSAPRSALPRRVRLALAGAALAVSIMTTVSVPAFAASPDLKPGPIGPIGPIGGFDDILNPLPPEPLPPEPPPPPPPDPPWPPRPGIDFPEEVLEVDPGGSSGPVDPTDHTVFMPMIAN